MHSSFVPPSTDRRRFISGLAASLLLAGCGHRSAVSIDPGVSYYTCAMHPSVRSNDPKGRCPICGMDLVPVLKEGAKTDGAIHSFTLSPDQIRLLGVTSAPLMLRDAARELRVPGLALGTNAVTASLFEGDVAGVIQGQRAEMTFDSLPRVTFSGRIAGLASSSDPISHRLAVRVALDRSDDRIRPGFAALVRIEVPLGKRLIAPTSAVLPTGERHVVLVDLGEGRIEPRYVEVGAILPDGWEILSGAREGERLVTSANFLIEAQARIEGALKGWGEIR